MDAVVAALANQQRELAELIGAATDEALEQPSRCPGWSGADVLIHLAQTNEMAVASTQGRLWAFIEGLAPDPLPGANVDEWAGALVECERAAVATVRRRWARSAADQETAFAAIDPPTRVEWVAGPMAARSLASTRLSETWIHTVDIADGLGVDLEPTDRLWHIARLAWRTVPYALATGGHEASGTVAFDLIAPDGAAWHFGPADGAATTVSGPALELCTVAGQRSDAADTSLTARGPDGPAVLRLVRTFA